MTNPNREELKAVIKEAIFELLSEIGSRGPRNSEQPTRSREEPAPMARGESNPIRNKPQHPTYNAVGPAVGSSVTNATTKPEWIRPADTRRVFGVSRAMVYDWIKTRKIESKVLRQRGKLTGIRLISYDSMKAYIESQMNES